MTRTVVVRAAAAALLSLAAAWPALRAAQAPHSAGLSASTLTIAGTSNVHDYTVTTSTIRVVRAAIAADLTRGDIAAELVKPGAVEAFEVAVPVASLVSGKDGMDKNLQKALNADKHPDVRFRLTRFEAGATDKALRAVGVLTIAGVDKDVTLPIELRAVNGGLVVKGALALLMTDYGIAPPKAMLGMLKTDPKVTVSFETTLAPAPSAVAGPFAADRR